MYNCVDHKYLVSKMLTERNVLLILKSQLFNLSNFIVLLVDNQNTFYTCKIQL